MKYNLFVAGLLCLLTTAFQLNLNAQSTFSRVTQILQSNCAASGCHGSSNMQVFDLSGSPQDLFDAIVGVTPSNAAAADKGHKLVMRGYPERSFLLRKISDGLGHNLAIDANEGDPCPKNTPALSKAEIELVRQWIMFGTPQTGQVVNEQTLIDFYNGKALPEKQAPTPPPAGEGFQLHDGPIFLEPGEEREFHWKFKIETGPVEVTRVEAFLSQQSHHYILYKYNPGFGNNIPEGHQRVDNITGQFDVQMNASMVATWQYDRDHRLPAGTAYYWEAGADLSSNFHVRNYDDDSILAAHVYMNVYTRPQGSGAAEMYSTLASYGGFNPFLLNIPNTAADVVLSFPQTIQETWNIWVLQAHTHKLGRDYDIFLRNPDGSKGQQIYEGWFDYEQGFNKGYYDFAHPSVLEFSPMLEVDMRNGLIHEATFFNDGPTNVGFGLTTNDEMFLTYMHYTKAFPTNIDETITGEKAQNILNVYPNPSNGQFNLNYQVSDAGRVRIEHFNVTGEQVALLKDEYQSKGGYMERFDASGLGLAAGLHIVRVSTSNTSNFAKLMLTE